MANSANFHVILSSSINPGGSVPFTSSDIVGTKITFNPSIPTNIVLATGRYLVNYSVAAWNMQPFNGVTQCKMMAFIDNGFFAPSFAGSAEANGASSAVGTFIFSVTASTSTLQLRVDQFGGTITEFTDITLTISELV